MRVRPQSSLAFNATTFATPCRVASAAPLERDARPCAKPRPDVVLVWYDISARFSLSLRTAVEEVQDIFCDMNVDIASRIARPGDVFARDGQPEIAVIILDRYPGHARRRNPSRASAQRRAA